MMESGDSTEEGREIEAVERVLKVEKVLNAEAIPVQSRFIEMFDVELDLRKLKVSQQIERPHEEL